MAWGVVGAAALVPLAMNPWGYNPFGPAKVFALAACATLVAIGLAIERELLRGLAIRLQSSWVARMVAVLWAVIFLSTLLSIDVRQSTTGSYSEYQGVLTWLAVTVIACGAASLQWRGSWQRVARALSVSILAMGVYALVQSVGLDPVIVSAGSAADRVRATLGNSSNAGVYLLLAAPFVLEQSRSDTSRPWRVVAGISVVLAVFMILFTASRGAWVGLLAGGLVWLAMEAVRWNGRRRLVAIAVTVTVIAALVVAVLAIPQLEKRIAPASAGTITWRLVVWQAAGRMALDRPVLGWGPNTFRYVYPSFRPHNVAANSNLGATTGDPHNMVMSAAASLGIPGVLGLLALIGTVGAACVGLARERADDDLKPIALTAALTGGFVALMFHYATLDTMPIAAVLVGLLVAARAKPRESPALAAGVLARMVAMAAAGVLSIALLAAGGLLGADAAMRGAFAAAADGAPWSSVRARLNSAVALAPWEPTFTWAIGKAAVQVVGSGGDPQAYADGQAALQATRHALPLDDGVIFDAAYLTLSQAVAARDADSIRKAQSVFAALSEKDPYNPKYWSARGMAAASLGDLAEAESDLKTAVSLAPGKKEYARALSEVESVSKTTP